MSRSSGCDASAQTGGAGADGVVATGRAPQTLLSGARLEGTNFTLAFNSELDGGSTPPGAAFRVDHRPISAHGLAGTIHGREAPMTVAGSVVTVTLTNPPPEDYLLQVFYDRGKAGENPLRDVGTGREVPSILGYWMTEGRDATPPGLLDGAEGSVAGRRADRERGIDQRELGRPDAGLGAGRQRDGGGELCRAQARSATVRATLRRVSAAKASRTPGLAPPGVADCTKRGEPAVGEDVAVRGKTALLRLDHRIFPCSRSYPRVSYPVPRTRGNQSVRGRGAQSLGNDGGVVLQGAGGQRAAGTLLDKPSDRQRRRGSVGGSDPVRLAAQRRPDARRGRLHGDAGVAGRGR